MRTTLDLPDELMKRAKIAAVKRGVTLRELVGAALDRELATRGNRSAKPRRVRFPLFASERPATLQLTNADLAQAERAEDLRRHGLSR